MAKWWILTIPSNSMAILTTFIQGSCPALAVINGEVESTLHSFLKLGPDLRRNHFKSDKLKYCQYLASELDGNLQSHNAPKM